VLGLDEDAQRDLSRQFEERIVEKQYVALVSGEPAPGTPDPLSAAERGEISLPLRADITRRPYQVVDWDRGREAVTRWRVLGREIDRIRVLFEPRTGRTHQLRVHAAAGAEAGAGAGAVAAGGAAVAAAPFPSSR
jgi:tRNA pseudouridine32 synthase/23S rRNA pseudouridine746 synthase